MKIENEHYRMVKAPGMSEVCKTMDEDPSSFKEKVAEEGPKVCLLCKTKGREVPAVRFTLGQSWRHDGEEVIFTFAVCQLHRGQWIWYPKNSFRAMDGMYRKTAVGEVIPPDEPIDFDEEQDLTDHDRDILRRKGDLN